MRKYPVPTGVQSRDVLIKNKIRESEIAHQNESNLQQ